MSTSKNVIIRLNTGESNSKAQAADIDSKQ